MNDTKKLEKYFDETDFEKSFLIGYYGGSNFGDELLLEIILSIFKSKSVKDIAFYYTNSQNYKLYHKDYGYTKVVSKLDILKNILKCKTIIIGGGGHWGLDFNKKTAVLSIILFVSRYILRKKVHLIGVGYYNSIPKYGRLFAYLASFSSNLIFARDDESFSNFSKASRKVSLVPDIAYLLPKINYDLFKDEVEDHELYKYLTNTNKVYLISTRHFSKRNLNEKNPIQYNQTIETLIKNTSTKIALLLLTSQSFDKENYQFFERLKHENDNVEYLSEFNFNPILMYFFLKQFHYKLYIIAPQFHLQLLSDLNRINFLPIYYDNKVLELQKNIGLKSTNISDITENDISNLL